MRLEDIKSVYFIGAGGIGMSALIRFFLSRNKVVAGYDRTPTLLTARLIEEGVSIHYDDDASLIPFCCRDPHTTLVVYTAAIPDNHQELNFFRNGGFEIQKRAQVLGTVTNETRLLCVAGTHGKTTTSTMIAHLFHQSHLGCTAFLGGISKNYDTNLLLSDSSPYSVVEADEFDRSFHWLRPYMSVVTAVDPDHLDVYGTPEAYLESFRHYTSLIREGGVLLLHSGLVLQPCVNSGVRIYTYGRNQGDYHAENIRIGNGDIFFDFVMPDGCIRDISLGVPISINIENGIAAMALAHLNGVTDEEILRGMESFKGVERRFEFRMKTAQSVLISDYAHHPAEIEQCARSIRELYQDRKITAIFQPHLYTRTRDFYQEFAQSLSLFDEVILTDLYPAREEPIPGVSSRLIFDCLSSKIEKRLCRKEEVVDFLAQQVRPVVIVLGAGDLDNYIPKMIEVLNPQKAK